MNNNHTAIAALVTVVSAGMLFSIIYLMFFLPRVLQTWADTGQALSASQQNLAETSITLIRFGIFVLPVALLCFAAALVWCITSVAQRRRQTPVA